MPKKIQTVYKNNRDQAVLKNMHYNRFLLFRYSLALFFFANLYWLISFFVTASNFWIVPLAVMVLSVPAIYEQVKLNGTTPKDMIHLNSTNRYFFVQLGVNLALILTSLTSWGMERLFEFIANTTKGWLFLFVILLVGAIISLLDVRRVEQIKNNSDKTLQAIVDFEKTSGKERKKNYGTRK